MVKEEPYADRVDQILGRFGEPLRQFPVGRGSEAFAPEVAGRRDD